MVRVAVVQIETPRDDESDGEHTLAACALLIDRAVAEHAAAIVLFPELGLSAEAELTDSLASTLSARAERHQIWLVGSVSHRGIVSTVWATPEGLLFSRPTSDLEQTGTGTFAPEAAIIATPHGKIGLCAGPESLHFKVSRALSLAGADLLCVSLAQRSDTELSLRLPARAAENELFLAAAVRVSGAPATYAAELVTLPPLSEASEPDSVSQIRSPSGHSLACGALAWAELALPLPDAEPKPSGKLARRPELYRGFPLRPRTRTSQPGAPVVGQELAELDVAALAYADLGSVEHAIAWAREHVEELVAKEVSLVVLPELFCFDSSLTQLHSAAADDFLGIVQTLARACRRSATHVATSLVERVGDAYFHVGVLIGQAGIVLRQQQLHLSESLSWATAGRRLETARLPWGRLGLLVGEDALVPEILDGLGRFDVEVVAAPLSPRVARLATLTLSAATDEAGYAVVAATRPEPADDGTLHSGSFVADPARWPVQRAQPEQEVLRATLRLSGLRAARAA